ncbi:15790_t:CDS:2, partial [Funneliformis caledonium]
QLETRRIVKDMNTNKRDLVKELEIVLAEETLAKISDNDKYLSIPSSSHDPYSDKDKSSVKVENKIILDSRFVWLLYKTRIKDVDRWYDTYCYKLHTYIVKLANEFKVTYECELSEFISKDKWCQIFHLHLKATDQQILRRNPIIIERLDTFTYQIVKAIIIIQSNKTNT